MKKSIAANWILAISVVLAAFVLVFPDASAQLLDRTLSLRDLASQLRTPEAITQYLWRNFTYENDRYQFGKDEVLQSPASFMATRKGDCDDFAIFAYEMLKANGIKAFLLNIHGGGYGHAVCAFKEGGHYTVIDGTEVRRFETEDLSEVAYQMYPFWERINIVVPVKAGPETYKGMILRTIERN